MGNTLVFFVVKLKNRKNWHLPINSRNKISDIFSINCKNMFSQKMEVVLNQAFWVTFQLASHSVRESSCNNNISTTKIKKDLPHGPSLFILGGSIGKGMSLKKFQILQIKEEATPKRCGMIKLDSNTKCQIYKQRWAAGS